jgi:hypothetical protein
VRRTVLLPHACCLIASSWHIRPMRIAAVRQQHVAELTAEADAEGANAEDGDEVKDDSSTFTTRSFVCEQQRLGVPANGAAGTKLKDFHDQIVELSVSLI